MQYDWSLEVLRDYLPAIAEPGDLAEFWRATLDFPREEPTITRVDSGLVAVETFDVTFAGFGGDPIRAWLHLPAAPLRSGALADRPAVCREVFGPRLAKRVTVPASPGDTLGQGGLPGVVQYQGYNGGRGLPHEHTFWATAGYAHLVVDTRGQGSGWTTGATADPVGSPPSQPGFLTRGIEDPHTYYYRRVYADAVRALEMLQSHTLVDSTRVVVAGASQGGGIAVAVAALAPTSVAAVLCDVPFLSDFRRAAAVAQTEPYLELVRYLAAHPDRVEQSFAALAYFDGAVLARLATAPALFSVALMDETCPPSTVFAAYNAYAGPKEIEVYQFNDHEGAEAFQRGRQLAWLNDTLGG